MNHETIFLCMLALVLAALVVSIISFAQARQEIAQFNKSQIEQCYILECDITPFGDVECRQAGIPDVEGLVRIGG